MEALLEKEGNTCSLSLTLSVSIIPSRAIRVVTDGKVLFYLMAK